MNEDSLFRQKGLGQPPIGQDQTAEDAIPSEQSGNVAQPTGAPVWRQFVSNKDFQENNAGAIQAEHAQQRRDALGGGGRTIWKGGNGSLLRKNGRLVEKLNAEDFVDHPEAGPEARKSLWDREIRSTAKQYQDINFKLRDPAFHAMGLSKADRDAIEAEGAVLQESDPRHAELKKKLVDDDTYRTEKERLAQESYNIEARKRQLEETDPETWWQQRQAQPAETPQEQRAATVANAQEQRAQAEAVDQAAAKRQAEIQAKLQQGVTGSEIEGLQQENAQLAADRGRIAQETAKANQTVEQVKQEASAKIAENGKPVSIPGENAWDAAEAKAAGYVRPSTESAAPPAAPAKPLTESDRRDIAAKYLGTGTTAQGLSGQDPGAYAKLKGGLNQITDANDGVSMALRDAGGDIDKAIEIANKKIKDATARQRAVPRGGIAQASGFDADRASATADAAKFTPAAKQLEAMKAEFDAAGVDPKDRATIIQDAAKAHAWTEKDADRLRALSTGELAINPGSVFGDKAGMIAEINASNTDPANKQAAIAKLEAMRVAMAEKLADDLHSGDIRMFGIGEFRDFVAEKEAKGQDTDTAALLDEWTAKQKDRNLVFKLNDALWTGIAKGEVGIAKTVVGGAAGIAGLFGADGAAGSMGQTQAMLGDAIESASQAEKQRGQTGGYAITSDLMDTVTQMAPMFAGGTAAQGLKGMSQTVTAGMATSGWAAMQGYESKLSDAAAMAREKKGSDLTGKEIAAVYADGKTQLAAFLNAAQTAALTKMLPGGSESAALGKMAKSMTVREFITGGGIKALRDKTLRTELKAMGKTIFADAQDETIEEGLNQALDLIISKGVLGKDVKLGDAIEEIVHSGAMGGFVGGALPQLRRHEKPTATVDDHLAAIDPEAAPPTPEEVAKAATTVGDAPEAAAEGVLIERELAQVEAEDEAAIAAADQAVADAVATGDKVAIKAAETAREGVTGGRAQTTRAVLKIASGQQLDDLTHSELTSLGMEETKTGFKPMKDAPVMVRTGADGSIILTDEALKTVAATSPRARGRVTMSEAEAIQKAKARAAAPPAAEPLSTDASNGVQGEPATGFPAAAGVAPSETGASVEYDVPMRDGTMLRVKASDPHTALEEAAAQTDIRNPITGQPAVAVPQAQPVAKSKQNEQIAPDVSQNGENLNTSAPINGNAAPIKGNSETGKDKPFGDTRTNRERFAEEDTSIEAKVNFAINNYESSGENWAKLRETGASDTEIAKQIEQEIGHHGSSVHGGYMANGVSLTEDKAGDGTTPRTIKGKELVAMVRDLMQIPTPNSESNSEQIGSKLAGPGSKALAAARKRLDALKKNPRLAAAIVEGGARAQATEGRIDINPEAIISEAVAKGMSESKAARYFAEVLDEEIRHLAQLNAARALFEQAGSPGEYQEWLESHYSALWKSDFTGEKGKIVADLYGAEFNALPEWKKAMEGVRMMSQGNKTTERGKLWINISENLRATLQAALDALKSLVADITSPTLQTEIQNLENALQSLTDQPRAGSPKADSEKPDASRQGNGNSRAGEAAGDSQAANDGRTEQAPSDQPVSSLAVGSKVEFERDGVRGTGLVSLLNATHARVRPDSSPELSYAIPLADIVVISSPVEAEMPSVENGSGANSAGNAQQPDLSNTDKSQSPSNSSQIESSEAANSIPGDELEQGDVEVQAEAPAAPGEPIPDAPTDKDSLTVEPADIDKFVTAYSNYHLARIAREAKGGKQSAEYYDQQRADWTPDKVRDRVAKFLDEIDSRDVGALVSYNNGMFDGFWKLFGIRTGMTPMPKTQKGIDEVIRSYVGNEAYEANEKTLAESRAKRAEENAAKDEEWRLRGLKSSAESAKVSYEGKLMNGLEFADLMLADGWRVENISNGPVPRYTFTKGGKFLKNVKGIKEIAAYAREKQKGMPEPIDEDAAREDAEFDNLPQEEKDAINSLFGFGGYKPPTAESQPSEAAATNEESSAVETPAEAAAEVKGEMVNPENRRPAKEIKAEIIQRVEEEIAKLPKFGPEREDVYSNTVIRSMAEEQHFRDQKEPRFATIKIPGDGTFLIKRTTKDLTELLSRVKRMSVTDRETKPTTRFFTSTITKDMKEEEVSRKDSVLLGLQEPEYRKQLAKRLGEEKLTKLEDIVLQQEGVTREELNGETQPEKGEFSRALAKGEKEVFRDGKFAVTEKESLTGGLTYGAFNLSDGEQLFGMQRFQSLEAVKSSLGIAEPVTPTVAESATVETAKPKTKPRAAKKPKGPSRIALLENYFTVGKLLPNGDRVLAFATDEDGQFEVRVIREDEDGARERTHSTMPDNKVLISAWQERETVTPDASAAETITPPAETVTDGGKSEKTVITDFGETIYGARKDLWGKFQHALTSELPEEGSDILLSKHLPEPDYQAAITAGVPVDSLATFKAIRDMIPSKPRKGYKLARWVTMIKGVRPLMQKLVAGEDADFRDDLATILSGNEEMRERVILYKELGFPAFTNAADWKILNDVTRWVGPEQIKRKVTAALNKSRFMAGMESENPDGRAAYKEVLDKVRAKILKDSETPSTKSKAIEFNIYSDRLTKDVFIGKKATNGVVRLKTGFATAKEARQHLADNQAELEAQWNGLKVKPDYRRQVNQPRQGPLRREGDASPELFQDAFGFRGVQFGNWVEGDRRQVDINEAFDAFMDLAAALGIPPKAVSLDGSLGLAFGARGHSGAAAHYEPDQVVINLTKKAGPGSLGHEWFHAFDNYFARLDKTGQTKATPLDRFATQHSSPPVNMRPEIWRAFRDIRAQLITGPFHERSKKLDEAKSKPYYGTVLEMAARAFERYTVERLEGMEISNDYLVNIVKDFDPALPTQEEMDNGIRQAFDGLFNALDAKETDKGIALHAADLPAAEKLIDFVKTGFARKVSDFKLEPENELDPTTQRIAREQGIQIVSSENLRDSQRGFEERTGARPVFFTGGNPETKGFVESAAPSLIFVSADPVNQESMPWTLIHELIHVSQRDLNAKAKEAYEGIIDKHIDDKTYFALQKILLDAGYHPEEVTAEIQAYVFTDVISGKSELGLDQLPGFDEIRESILAYVNGLSGLNPLVIKPTLFSKTLRAAALPDVEPAPFYSQLSRTIEAKMPKSATPAQALSIATSGAKAEEIKWSGIIPKLQELAAGNGGKVEKAALLEYLATEGTVQFKEVILGSTGLDVGEGLVVGRYGDEWALFRIDEGDDGDPVGGTFDSREEADSALREMESDGPTKYAQYTLPGGENYREVLLTIKDPRKEVFGAIDKEGIFRGTHPSREQAREKAGAGGTVEPRFATPQTSEDRKKQYTSPHFPEAQDYVAHMRLNERKDADGKPGLFIEEIQSDRHQAGRNHGYKNTVPTDDEVRRFFKLVDGADPADYRQEMMDHHEFKRLGVADAPFRKDWSLAMFKRALRDAVASGKEWIGWTPGSVQNDRFDLSKQIDAIDYTKTSDGKYRVVAMKGGENAIDRTVTESELPDMIGKEVAQKIINGDGERSPRSSSRGNQTNRLSGIDLKVGGSGMIGFYDQILPKEIGKYVKQWNSKVEQSTASDAPIWKVSITPEMKAGVSVGQALYASSLPEAEESTGDMFKKRVKVDRALVDEAKLQQKAFGKNVASGKLASFGDDANRLEQDALDAYYEYQREVKTNADALEVAKKRFEADPALIEEKLQRAAMGESGEYIDAADQLAFRMLIEKRAYEAGNDPEKHAENMRLRMALRQQRGDLARQMQIGYDRSMSPEERAQAAINEAIYTPSARVARYAENLHGKAKKAYLDQAAADRIAEVEKVLAKMGLDLAKVTGKNRSLQLENSRLEREMLKTRNLLEQSVLKMVQHGATLTDIRRRFGKEAAMQAQAIKDKARAELGEKLKEMLSQGMTREQIREAMKPSLKAADVGGDASAMSPEEIAALVEQMLVEDLGLTPGAIPATPLPRIKKVAAPKAGEEKSILTSDWNRPEFTDGLKSYEFDAKDRSGIMERVEIIRGLAGAVGKIEELAGENRAKAEAKLKEIDQILSKYGTNAQGIFESAKGIESYGFDLKDIAQVAAVARAINAIDADVVDKASEYLYASMLSGFQTMLVNATAIIPATWEATVGRGVEMSINSALNLIGKGDPMAPQWGEAKYIIRALGPAISRAMSNFHAAMVSQHPMFDRDVNAMDIDWDKILGGGSHKMIGSISGKKGDIIRLPMRLLTATDDFNRTLLACAEVGAFAYRLGKAKGHKPGSPEMDRFIRIEVNTPGSFSYQLASRKASRAIFSNPLPGQMDPHTGKEVPTNDLGDKVGWLTGKITDAVSKEHENLFLKAAAAAFRISFFPFQRTPFNILRKGIRYTPNPFSLFDIGLGIVSNSRATNPDGTTKWEWNAKGRNPELIERAGQQLQGAILMSLLIATAAGEGDDDDMKKPLVITGSLPFLPTNMAERDARMRSGVGAYRVSFRRKDGSERFGFNYGRLEPVATLLSATIDTIKSAKRSYRAGGNSYDAAAAALGGFASQAQDKTFMRGVGDLISLTKNIVTEPDLKENRKFLQFLAGRVAMVVPNLIKQPIREIDPNFRERGEGFMQELLYQVAPYGQKEAKVDPYGRTIEKTGFAAVRPVDPTDTGTDPVNAIDDMLIRWQDSGKWSKAEDPKDRKPYFPAPILNAEFKNPKTGISVKMNAEQLSEYREKAGKMAMTLIKKQNLNMENPTALDVAKVRDAVSKARSDMKKALAHKFSK